MSRTFTLRPVIRKPLLLPPAPKPAASKGLVQRQETEPDFEKQIRDLLFRYELAEQEKQRLQKDNEKLFTRLQELDADQKEVKDILRRLFYTTNGPPPQVAPGHSSHIWAKGDTFYVEVVYKKKSSYYDPKLLPKAVFLQPGVVTEVDKSVLDKLAKTDGRIRDALVQGPWMTPALSIPRAIKESQAENGNQSETPQEEP